MTDNTTAASLTGFEFATKVRDPFPQPHIEATKLALTATPETFPHDSYSLAQWLDKALFTPVPSEDDATQTREAELERIVRDMLAGKAGARDAARAALNALSCKARDQAIESPHAALNARGGCAQPTISEQNPLGAVSSSEGGA